MTRDCITQSQADRLLRNKFVFIKGDSIQRFVYKDLVLLLEKGAYLTMAQLKLKGEMSFESDTLLEGSLLCETTNSEDYREVRQYCGSHNLIRLYYTTEIISNYTDNVLAAIDSGVKPDIIILNSCVWDLSRFSQSWVPKYGENIHKTMAKLKEILPPECIVMWNMSMPVSGNIVGGYFQPQVGEGQTCSMPSHSKKFFSAVAHYAKLSNCSDFEFSNWGCSRLWQYVCYSGMVANSHSTIMVDMHFHIRQAVQSMKDGPPTIAVAYQRITCLLLEHAAHVWDVEQYLPHR
ncbi:PC-esterase domain-containing protein 1A [Scleropages formosus]|uniref:PC-esterase domain-containing protein 1A n=1 Tax=Scleropages formosus TaxID=113540 RepID=UPI0010FAACD6|nr:PC-esterase domain-containing protein 1A [Scleropages formosus]